MKDFNKTNKFKYVELWRKYLPSIIRMVENCAIDLQSEQLDSGEFEVVGNRKNYSFNLEFINNEISNNISGSAVARDLATVIRDSKQVHNLLASGHFKFRMDKRYCLWIKKL